MVSPSPWRSAPLPYSPAPRTGGTSHGEGILSPTPLWITQGWVYGVFMERRGTGVASPPLHDLTTPHKAVP